MIQGQVTDPQALARAFSGQEACICTAGNASKDQREFRRIFAGTASTTQEYSLAAAFGKETRPVPLFIISVGMKRLFMPAEVVRAASGNMIGPKRIWLMAGVTLLAVPHTQSQLALNDLPIFRWLPFR